MRLRLLPAEKLKNVLTIEEHAELVLELLKEQRYTTSVGNDDLCPVKNEFLLMKLKDTIREMEMLRTDATFTPISPGAHVSTRSMDVCPMGPRKRVRGVRKETHGNVVKASDYFPGYWLVHFFSEEVNDYYYCKTKTLKFQSSATVTAQVGPGLFNNNITSVPIQTPPHDNEEAIMLCLLNDKIHKCEGYKNISVNEIVTMFQLKFSWLTQTKINYFIQKFRRNQNKRKNKSKKKNDSKKSPNSVSTPSLSVTETPNTSSPINNNADQPLSREYILIHSNDCFTFLQFIISNTIYNINHKHHYQYSNTN